MKRKYPFSFFVHGLLMNLLSHSYILLISVVLLVLGRRLELVGLERLGWVIFVTYFIICVILQIKIRHTALTESDNEEFNELMDSWFGVEDESTEKYLTMSPLELDELIDCDLLLAIACRTEAQIKRAPSLKEGFDSLLEYQKIFYSCYCYSKSFEAGGLFALLTSPYRVTLTYTVDALNVIGAYDHSSALASFLHNNSINAYELSEFDVSDKQALKALKKKYDFKGYNEKYGFELVDEVEPLVLFARENIHIF